MSNPLFGAIAGIMEITINRVITLDPSYQEKLNPIAGRVIALSFTDWQQELFFLPDENQFVVLSEYQGNADVKLSGNSWDFFHLGINQQSSDAAQIIDSNIHFEGKVSVGQQFAQLFSELNIDWEEALAEVTGDIIAHRTANIIRQAGGWLTEVFTSTQNNLGEYLQEELRVTPAKIEIENFYDDLADLRADSARILARFKLLENKITNASNLADDPSR